MTMVQVARWLAAVIVTVAVAGCGAAAGDGDLVDDWAALAEPKRKDPVVGCYDAPIRYTVDINTVPTPVIPCEQAHTVETFHVGRFPDGVTAVPAEGATEYWGAFDECERLAAGFLGGQWFDTRIDLAINVPSGTQWEDGARWYRCELMETSTSNYLLTRRTGTLRDGARPGAPFLERCVTVAGPADSGMQYLVPTDCDKPHDAEYAGAFKVDGTTYPQDQRVYERCWDLVAGFLGGTRDGIQLGYRASFASQRAWSRGDRHVRCYAWRDDGKLTGTVKGLGNAAPR